MTTRLQTVTREALTLNGVDVKLIVYLVAVAFGVYFFFDGRINASEQKMTQAIETVASDNLLATERISLEFRLFVLRQQHYDLLKIETPNTREIGIIADTSSQIDRLAARQRELDRLVLERRTSGGGQ